MILALRTRCTRARNAKAPTRRARKHGEHNSDLPRPSRNVTSLSGIFWGMSFHDWLPPTPQIRRGRLASLARTHTWSYSAPSHAGLFLYRTLTNRKQQKRRRANVSPTANRGPDRPLHTGIGVSFSFGLRAIRRLCKGGALSLGPSLSAVPRAQTLYLQ
jgi:hypothetical protein